MESELSSDADINAYIFDHCKPTKFYSFKKIYMCVRARARAISEIHLILTSFSFNDFMSGTNIFLFFFKETTSHLEFEENIAQIGSFSHQDFKRYLKLSRSDKEACFCACKYWYLQIILISTLTLKTTPCLLFAFHH